MVDLIADQITEAKNLLNERKFREGLRVISTINRGASTREQQIELILIKAELNLYLGINPGEDEIMIALAHYKASTDTTSYALAKYLHGCLLSRKGNFAEAREILLEAYVHYKRCDDYVNQAKALSRLCYVLTILGDIENAIRYLSMSIELLERYSTVDNAKTVMMNLGSVYYLAGRLSRSIETYDKIEKDVMGNRLRLEYFYHNQAMPYALIGDMARAKSIIKHAYSDLPDSDYRNSVYFENLGWIYLLEGNFPAAEKALLQGLEMSMHTAPESALVSQIKRRLADAYLGQDKRDQAQRFANEAFAIAEKVGEQAEIAACYRIYAQLRIRQGNQNLAQGLFFKAIDIFSIIGSRYELAATRYLAAVSGIYQNSERQALLYLARDYFKSEDVAPYLAKIDQALKKLPTPSVRTAGQAPTIIAESTAMRKLIELARHVAKSEMTILLTGPTGTGKDLLSEYIHYYSGRTGKYVPVNTAAIPDGMIESELFGHRKGAFTGAEHRKLGLVDEAAGGTLYLNEIADSSPEFQAKLLDVLERRQVRSLGSTIEHKVDFRLIAASNKDLAELVRQNRFRADLYHRLNQVNLALPPLDDRKEDIPALVKYFVTMCGIKPDTSSGNGDTSSLTRFTSSLASHSWVGNVRALKAKVERLAFTCKGDLVRMAEVAESTPDSTESDAERDHLIQLLETTGWNRREVARRMGIAEGTVRYKIAKYGLNPMVKS